MTEAEFRDLRTRFEGQRWQGGMVDLGDDGGLSVANIRDGLAGGHRTTDAGQLLVELRRLRPMAAC